MLTCHAYVSCPCAILILTAHGMLTCHAELSLSVIGHTGGSTGSMPNVPMRFEVLQLLRLTFTGLHHSRRQYASSQRGTGSSSSSCSEGSKLQPEPQQPPPLSGRLCQAC